MIERNIHNYKMYIDTSAKGIQGWLSTWRPGTPDREPGFEYLLRQEVKPGMTCVELGANVGYLTFMMWKNLEGKGKVYAIEPDPRNYKMLSKSVGLNEADGEVMTYPFAIDNKVGEVQLHLGIMTNLSSIRPTKNTTGKTVDVKTVTLTSFSSDVICFGPNFIKMDIEGHEVEALEGGYDLFEKDEFPCKILMEVHPQFLDGKRFEKIIREYIKLGFNYKYVISAATPQPDKFRDRGYSPIKTFPGGWPRGLYDNISNDDAIYLSCYPHIQKFPHSVSPKICRSVMLERK